MGEENKEIVLKESNTVALLGFIFSLTGCLTFVGLILSVIGLATAKKYKNDRRGFSIAGIVISCLLLSIAGVMINFDSDIADTIDSKIKSKSYYGEIEMVEIIDFSSMSKDEAEDWCLNNGINCNIKTEYSDSIEKDAFIKQSVEPSKKIEKYTAMDIYYSLGRKKTDAELENEYKAECGEIDYREVLRTPSDFAYKKVHWFGKVSQVVDSSYSKSYMIYVNCEENSYSQGGYICNDAIYVKYNGSQNLIEDDVVDMWGYMASTSYTYTTVLGASRTIPLFNAQYITIH